MVYIMALNFYCLGILYPTACYRETAGLFKHTKNILFYTATINIILSVVLGKIFGIEGILFATILARVLTNMWFEPYKLFKVFFDKKVLRYYLKKIIELVMLIFCVALINWISQINGGYPVWIRFIFKCALCCVIPNALIICVSYRTDEFKYVMDSINGFFHIKRKKE